MVSETMGAETDGNAQRGIVHPHPAAYLLNSWHALIGWEDDLCWEPSMSTMKYGVGGQQRSNCLASTLDVCSYDLLAIVLPHYLRR